MKWTVTFTSSAKSELAQIWLQSSRRRAVTHAADHLEVLLAATPLDAGESREGISRLLILQPLAIHFDVHADDMKVVVWRVIDEG